MKFPNGYTIQHCPKEFLDSPIKSSYKHLLTFSRLKSNWEQYKKLRIFIFWAAKKKEITEYCHLYDPLPEPETDADLAQTNFSNNFFYNYYYII